MGTIADIRFKTLSEIVEIFRKLIGGKGIVYSVKGFKIRVFVLAYPIDPVPQIIRIQLGQLNVFLCVFVRVKGCYSRLGRTKGVFSETFFLRLILKLMYRQKKLDAGGNFDARGVNVFSLSISSSEKNTSASKAVPLAIIFSVWR